MKKLPMSSAADESPAGEVVMEGVAPDAAIRVGVLTSLGRPPELYRVDVLSLWSNHYRVNVMVGADPTSLRIAHSYFVEAGADGHILTATPQVFLLYPQPPRNERVSQ